MDVQQGNNGKPRTINGDFYCSHQEPVSDTASNNNNDKKFSKIPSRCQLNCEDGCLQIYGHSMTTPFLILPKIWKVSRQKHDKEFFCLEYGTETDRFNIFLTIEDKRIADDWELALCILTEQTPPNRRRTHTDSVNRTKRSNNTNTRSSPSAPQGFSLIVWAEQDGGDVSPTNGDATDETMSVEHEDDTILTCSSDTQPEPEDTQAPLPSTMSLGADQQTDDTLTLHIPRTSRRDGKRTPEEGHVGDVVGYDNVSPTPPNSPTSGLSDTIPNKAHVDNVIKMASLKLNGHQQQEHQQQQQQEGGGQEQHATNDEILSEILPLVSEMGIPQSSEQQLPGELRPTKPVYQCTHIEIECSQAKSSLTLHKEDLLSTGQINDMFVFYRGSVYSKSCPESFQSQLFIGTRILQMNNQEPVDARRAIDYITTSAGQTVNLLVQLFPLGVRVRLCVPSVAALGITLYGNEILSMHEDGVLSRIADGLRCVCPALSTTDMPSPSVGQRSITSIGDSHVPFDATSDEVEDMLDSAIKSGNGHLVLQLQPTEFCQAIAPDALHKRYVEEGNALLNPRPGRRPSLAQILLSNPPS